MSDCNNPQQLACCLVFDWDDTLFPSTSLQETKDGLVPDKSLEEHFCKVLEEALRLAPDGTYIVTNALEGWVQQCVQSFYPAALPLLERVQVVSARQRFFQNTAEGNKKKATCPEDLCTWKAAALQDLTKEGSGRGLSRKDGPLNVIAIGDAPTDTKAAKTLPPLLPDESLLKTVQLIPAPSMSCFGEQLRLILGAMAKVVSYPKSASLCVGPQQPKSPQQQPSSPQKYPASAAVANKEEKSKSFQRRGSSHGGGCRSAVASITTNTPEVPMVHQ